MEVEDGSNHRFICDCGGDEMDSGGDGFFYCTQCGSQSQSHIATETDMDDVFGSAGGVGALYSLYNSRAAPRYSVPQANPCSSLSKKNELFRSLMQSADGSAKEESKASPYGFEEKLSSPQDFGYQGWQDPGKAVGVTRLRYVQGLQVMLQLQCEALVENFGVSPLVCGIAMTVWLRYVANSTIFADDWVERMIDEAKFLTTSKVIGKNKPVEKGTVAGRKGVQGAPKKSRSKSRTGHLCIYGPKAISISFRYLRKSVPVYSTLAIAFLACHLARESILPTDVVEWASEAKLPYLAAFVELEKYLGAPKFIPLSTRLMFRPIRIINAGLLEVTAASIAQCISLRMPSVNFYAIALRYLKELSLPIAKILPQACHLYEWSLPSELWLSSCNYALPTRVYVMAIIIVTIRILYNINGQGIWESLFDCSSSTSSNHKNQGDLDSLNLKFNHTLGSSHFCTAEPNNAEPPVMNDCSSGCVPAFFTKDLLEVLDDAYQRMTVTPEYSKDLRSYLKYGRDVIFAGLTPSYSEEKLIERLWDLYDKQEDQDDKQHCDSQNEFFGLKVKRPSDEDSINQALDSKKPKGEKQNFTCVEAYDEPSCSAAGRRAAIENMKLDMQDNGFHYLPPRAVKRSNGYLHYERWKEEGKLLFVAHVDYYILLRACARLAQVEPRILHIGVLKFEKRLHWIEQRVEQSLYSLRNFSLRDGVEMCSSGS
ncbi:hypothetical protein HPP92_021577 [Vanilla planifolia]|uniref:TATA box-binding protein-associated factor RNA polymerase I subunit B n=1 Tax=Vanilla planifolia TaxID=51239 RepID=A0A835PZ38_VANPL|nr:hypothetical protein HPP92_021577 [Vanilla planifolia]